MTRRLRVVGPGRAGRALAQALETKGWTCVGMLERTDPPAAAARDVDLLVIATPDRVVGEVAALVEPVPETLVVHLAGSLGLDVLAGHLRRGSLHPLVSLPTPEEGSRRLLDAAWFAVAGATTADRGGVEAIVADLAGQSFPVADADRAAYHAAACVAANHLVALLGQVERIAAPLGVPLGAFLALAQGALDGVADLGPAAALTGPVARGDWPTVAGHLAALDADERPAYAALAEAAWRLHHDPVETMPPDWLTVARGAR
jgi:predicted short-subunit dehydrogenase-like oxidoreductase (DUF2520 family)